jgi:hypothetical protein
MQIDAETAVKRPGTSWERARRRFCFGVHGNAESNENDAMEVAPEDVP